MKPLLKFGEEKQPLVINTTTELILTVMQVIVQTGVGKNWHVILKSAVQSHYSHHGVQNLFFLIFNGAYFFSLLELVSYSEGMIFSKQVAGLMLVHKVKRQDLALILYSSAVGATRET